MTLPKGWTSAKLDEFTLPRVEQGEPRGSAVPYIDIGSIDRDLKRVGPTDKVTSTTAPTRARQWVTTGDVLVSLTRPNLNAVALVTPELDGAVASTGFDVLRPEGVLSEWVFNRVRTQGFVSDVCEDVQGVVYPAIRPADVRRHEMPIPPLQEQQRIVEAIDSYITRLDDAVASLERVQATLKAYRASVLKAAVEGRLVPTEAALARAEKRDYEPAEALLARILKERRRRWEVAELAKLKAAGKTAKDDKWKAKYEEPVAPDAKSLPELPEGWCWASAAALCTAIGDVDHKMPDRAEGGIPYVSTKDFRGFNEIDFAGAKLISPSAFEQLCRKIQPQFGDILLSRYGTVGEVRMIETQLPFQASYSIAILKPVDNSISAYLGYALRSAVLQTQMRTWTRASAQPDLGLAHIRQFSIPLPPIVEQERIMSEVDRLLSISSRVETGMAADENRIQRLRQAILKWAFEGRLVDQDPADEPAEALLARIRAERADTVPDTKSRGRRAKKTA